MLFLWQSIVQHGAKRFLAHLHIIMDLCAIFQVNRSKTEEVEWSTRFFMKFIFKNVVAIATHCSLYMEKVSCAPTPYKGPMCQETGLHKSFKSVFMGLHRNMKGCVYRKGKSQQVIESVFMGLQRNIKG